MYERTFLILLLPYRFRFDLKTWTIFIFIRTQRKMEKSRINILSCSFICGTVVQFGVALNFSHFNAADDMAARNQTLQDCVVSYIFSKKNFTYKRLLCNVKRYLLRSKISSYMGLRCNGTRCGVQIQFPQWVPNTTWCWPWTSQLYHSLGGLLLD